VTWSLLELLIAAKKLHEHLKRGKYGEKSFSFRVNYKKVNITGSYSLIFPGGGGDAARLYKLTIQSCQLKNWKFRSSKIHNSGLFGSSKLKIRAFFRHKT